MVKQGLELTPFVGELLADEFAQEGFLSIVGYIGEGAPPGSTRVYLDPDLQTSVDVPDDAIRYFLNPEVPNRPTRLWLRSTATLSVASFFVGPANALSDLIGTGGKSGLRFPRPPCYSNRPWCWSPGGEHVP